MMSLPGFTAKTFTSRYKAEELVEQCKAEKRRVSMVTWGSRWKVEYENTLEEITASAERNKRLAAKGDDMADRDRQLAAQEAGKQRRSLSPMSSATVNAELLVALTDLDKVFDFSQRLDPGDFDIEDHAFASAAFVQARDAIKAAKGDA